MRTHVDGAKEETGKAPECTGAKLEIKKISRQYVKKADSDFVGCAQYVVQLQIIEPKSAANMTVFDRIRVGTPDDKEAAKKSTWEVSEGGPARVTRLLKRSGTAITKDDEEWMADAVGRTVIAPIDHRGEYVNVGLYYREADKDCPEIGLKKAKAGTPGARRPVEAEPEEDATEAEEAPEEESKPEPKKAPAKKPAKAPVEEEEED